MPSPSRPPCRLAKRFELSGTVENQERCAGFSSGKPHVTRLSRQTEINRCWRKGFFRKLRRFIRRWLAGRRPNPQPASSNLVPRELPPSPSRTHAKPGIPESVAYANQRSIRDYMALRWRQESRSAESRKQSSRYRTPPYLPRRLSQPNLLLLKGYRGSRRSPAALPAASAVGSARMPGSTCFRSKPGHAAVVHTAGAWISCWRRST